MMNNQEFRRPAGVKVKRESNRDPIDIHEKDDFFRTRIMLKSVATMNVVYLLQYMYHEGRISINYHGFTTTFYGIQP